MLSDKTTSVTIDMGGARKKDNDLAPLRAGESRIAAVHWQALVRASGKAEAALLTALVRKQARETGG